MNKKILATVIGLSLGSISIVNASSLEDLTISGFGSVGVGTSDNDAGYAGYDSQRIDTTQETLAGIQIDFQLNKRAKFVTQFVANSRYSYEPKVEMAYASYEFDDFTARAGKLRLPLFFYSDYMDLGYAMPMIRTSPELYDNIVLKGYTGGELLIPIEFEDSTLLLQPVVGVGNIDEDDSSLGEVDLNGLMGLSANWNYEDITLRGSYMVAEADPQCTSGESKGVCDYYDSVVGGQDGQFISLGAQYDNGDLLVNLEAADVQMKGSFYDYRSVSGLIGYRIDSFTPYVAMGWVETTDNEERPEDHYLSYERISYSIGTRWDFAQNMALKFDVTYSDYQDTTGGLDDNVTDINSQSPDYTPVEDSSIIYSARLDFVF